MDEPADVGPCTGFEQVPCTVDVRADEGRPRPEGGRLRSAVHDGTDLASGVIEESGDGVAVFEGREHHVDAFALEVAGRLRAAPVGEDRLPG